MDEERKSPNLTRKTVGRQLPYSGPGRTEQLHSEKMWWVERRKDEGVATQEIAKITNTAGQYYVLYCSVPRQ